jgi:hypothetical protein
VGERPSQLTRATVPRGPGRLPFLLAALALQFAPLLPSALLAQDPDSAAVQEPDTVGLGAQAPEDSVQVIADSLIVPAFPLFPDPAERRPGVVAQWDMPNLLATGALDFAELLELTPLLDPLRSGFLEGPQAAVFAGGGPASLRYDIDGFEVAPLTGGPLDLHLIPLVEDQQIRMIREPGGYRAAAHTYRRDRPEPYSRIEGGSGDQGTNLLRAFLSTGAFGLPFGFGFDQIDTQGNPETGSMRRQFLWASVAGELPGHLWGQVEYRNTNAGRDSFPNPRRIDWIFRLRRPFGDGWHTDLVAGTSTVEKEPLPEPGPDTTEVPTLKATARQVALRGARTSEHWNAYVSLRAWDGENVPIFTPEATVEVELGPASVYLNGSYAKWEDFTAAGLYGALQFDLPLGVQLFAEGEEGDRGLFGGEPIKRQQYTRWTAGLEVPIWGVSVGGRAGRWRVTPSAALGPPVDSINFLPGGTVGVVEAWVSGPILTLFGGTVEAGARLQAHEAGEFLYWPENDWRMEGLYHLLALQDQLEVWLKGIYAVRGPMRIAATDPGQGVTLRTPNLYWGIAELVVRVKDVHIYFNYEYFDAPLGAEDLPGRGFPETRTHFGLKWEFWN